MAHDDPPQSRTFANEPRPALPGDLVAGKYVIERVIGQGGMGQVVAARHETLGTRVAIKLINANEATDPETVARFKREALLMAKLRGEHLVRVHDVGETEYGVPYIIMEHLEGKDLAALARGAGGKLPPAQVVEYAMQACEALAEVHDVGIVHRDLKPSNLFLATTASGKQSIRLLDFGIAKQRNDKRKSMALTTQDSVVGTLQYMAPEQIDGSREVDARTDIWGLGACLYRLLTGRLPFLGASEGELVGAMFGREGPPTPHDIVPEIPPALSDVVMRCLARAPAARFGSMREVAQALDASRRPVARPPASFSATLPLGAPAPAPPPPTSITAAPPSGSRVTVPPISAPPISARSAGPAAAHPSPWLGIAIAIGMASVVGLVGGVVLLRSRKPAAAALVAVDAPRASATAVATAPTSSATSTTTATTATQMAAAAQASAAPTTPSQKKRRSTAPPAPSGSAPRSKEALYDDL